MNKNDINNLGITEDVKRMYNDLYEVTDNENINLDKFKEVMLRLANYNYYTASIDSDIINEIIDTNIRSFNLFSDSEKEYLQFINYAVEDKDIFLDNPVFNYEDHYNKFKLLNEFYEDPYITEQIIYSAIIYDYNEFVDFLYGVYEIPERLTNYIDDERLIRDEVLSNTQIISTNPNNHNFNKNDLFLFSE